MKDVTNVKEIDRIHNVTWDRLVELEPDLNKLLAEARSVGECCRTWRDVEKGWTPFKNPTHNIVAYPASTRGILPWGTVAVYDVVYWKLHNGVARDRRGD